MSTLMDPYALIPLVSCVLCAGYCLSVWTGPSTLDDQMRRSYTRGLMGVFACYTGIETAVRLSDPEPTAFAHTILMLWAVSLIAIGPVAIETCFKFSLRPHPSARRWAGALHGLGAVLIVCELVTREVFIGLQATPFGTQATPGDLYMAATGYVLTCGLFAFWVLSRALEDSPRFSTLVSAGGVAIRMSVFLLIAVATITDVVMPMLGRDAPQLASVGFGLLALVSLFTISQRDGGHITASPALISEHILHALNESVAFLDTKGRVLLANESLGHLLGKESSQLVGLPFAGHLPGFVIEGAPNRLDIDSELHCFEGHTLPVSVSISTVQDGRGTPLGQVIVIRDVRELETLKSRLVMSGRLAAVGEMAAGIAHEINNPISFVRTNLGVLREHWVTLDDALRGEARNADVEDVLKDGEELIAESVEGVDRAAAIVRDVRELSHAGPSSRVHGNLNQILERVIRLASPEMAPGVTIERRFSDGCRAEVSPDQMTQVFVNLLTNALHAIAGRGHIVVESRRHEGRVEVSVIDDGGGVPEAIRNRIFDPFYTTKDVGVGTGLGLSISHEIVRGHGGELVYCPTPTGGACFTVHLEASPQSSSKEPGSKQSGSSQSGSKESGSNDGA